MTDFKRRWTAFMVDAEVETFGAGRLTAAHNERIDEMGDRLAFLEANIRCALAILTQNKTYPADVEAARNALRYALETKPASLMTSEEQYEEWLRAQPEAAR